MNSHEFIVVELSRREGGATYDLFLRNLLISRRNDAKSNDDSPPTFSRVSSNSLIYS